MSHLLITNAALLDLQTGTLHPGSSVRVEDDRIAEVAVGRSLERRADNTVIDADGRILMPGLIDAHVHAIVTSLDLNALAHRPATRLGIEAAAVLEGMLRRGFTTVRDAGGLDRGLQEALDAGLVKGPRVFRSGRVLSQTGGHGDLHPAGNEPHLCAGEIVSTQFAHVADGPDAVRRAVREELKAGAQLTAGPRTTVVDGVEVALGGDAVVGGPSDLHLAFTDASTGAPIDDLQPFLAAAGHVVVMRADGATFAHEHAEVEDEDGRPVFATPGQDFGPELDVHAEFDTPGVYQLWSQFRLADGDVITVPFTVEAS